MFSSRFLTPSKPLPELDAVGAFGNAVNFNFAITIGANAKALVVPVSGWCFISAIGFTVKVGATEGSATTLTQQLNVNTYGVSSYAYSIGLYTLLNPPTGSMNVYVSTGPGGYVQRASAGAVTYKNVTSFGTAQWTNGASSSASHTVTSGSGGQLIFQAFTCTSSSATAQSASISSYNQTSRATQTGVANDVMPWVLGDALGSSSVSFTATAPSSGLGNWGSVAIPLIP